MKLHKPPPPIAKADPIKESALKDLCLDRWIAVCREFCHLLGFQSRNIPFTQNRVVAFTLHLPDNPATIAYVQCYLHSQTRNLDQKVTRFQELLKIDDIANGIVFSSGSISSELKKRWSGTTVELIDSKEFIRSVGWLNPKATEQINQRISAISFTAPICTKCGAPMTEAHNGLGKFWRCSNAPECGCTYMA